MTVRAIVNTVSRWAETVREWISWSSVWTGLKLLGMLGIAVTGVMYFFKYRFRIARLARRTEKVLDDDLRRAKSSTSAPSAPSNGVNANALPTTPIATTSPSDISNSNAAYKSNATTVSISSANNPNVHDNNTPTDLNVVSVVKKHIPLHQWTQLATSFQDAWWHTCFDDVDTALDNNDNAIQINKNTRTHVNEAWYVVAPPKSPEAWHSRLTFLYRPACAHTTSVNGQRSERAIKQVQQAFRATQCNLSWYWLEWFSEYLQRSWYPLGKVHNIGAEITFDVLAREYLQYTNNFFAGAQSRTASTVPPPRNSSADNLTLWYAHLRKNYLDTATNDIDALTWFTTIYRANIVLTVIVQRESTPSASDGDTLSQSNHADANANNSSPQIKSIVVRTLTDVNEKLCIENTACLLWGQLWLSQWFGACQSLLTVTADTSTTMDEQFQNLYRSVLIPQWNAWLQALAARHLRIVQMQFWTTAMPSFFARATRTAIQM